MFSSDFWVAVSAISSCISLIVVIFGIVFGYKQLKEMANARSLEALLRVFDELSSPEANTARRDILHKTLPPPEQVNRDDKVYEQMHAVWTSYDKVGILVARQLIPEHLVLETYYGSIIMTWRKLEPYIGVERAQRGSLYQDHFERLYKRSLVFRDKYHPMAYQDVSLKQQ